MEIWLLVIFLIVIVLECIFLSRTDIAYTDCKSKSESFIHDPILLSNGGVLSDGEVKRNLDSELPWDNPLDNPLDNPWDRNVGFCEVLRETDNDLYKNVHDVNIITFY